MPLWLTLSVRMTAICLLRSGAKSTIVNAPVGLSKEKLAHLVQMICMLHAHFVM